jgi:hypothetical protein
VLDKLAGMEKAGSRVWPFFGSVYVIVARKCVIPLTPVRKRWALNKRLLPTGAAEPTARTSHRQRHE